MSDDDVKVYNSSTSHCNPISWGSICHKVKDEWTKSPSQKMMWYPSLVDFSSEFLFKLSWFFSHLIPAYVLDFIGYLSNASTKAKWVNIIDLFFFENRSNED